PRLDLSGRDFRKLDLSEASLEHVNVDGADFREAKLLGTSFGKVRGARFDGARIDNLNEAEDCSFKNAEMIDLYPERFARCDFTGANLRRLDSYDLNAPDCIFRKADLSGANLADANLKNSDLSGANLTDATLTESNLTGANLSGADLTCADL